MKKKKRGRKRRRKGAGRQEEREKRRAQEMATSVLTRNFNVLSKKEIISLVIIV
jgi:hypothetical protein